MSLRILAVVIACLWATPLSAEVLWSRSMQSRALSGALNYSIYLPPGYHDPRDEAQAVRYPVVYVLPGVGDSERSYPAYARVEALANRLIINGDIPPMLLVMPDGKTSWYVDSATVGGPGDFETAIVEDLITYIDATYRTNRAREARFVTGHSMGGFGALRLAFKHPEIFAAAAAMSSALWDRVTPDFVLPERAERIFQGAFGSPFDPNAFLAQRPRAYVDDLKAILAETSLDLPIYLSAGDDDQFRAYQSTFVLFSELREAELGVDLRIFDGGHSWVLWREQALPDALTWFASHLTDDRDAAIGQ